MTSYLPTVVTMLLCCTASMAAADCGSLMKYSLCTCVESTLHPEILDIICSRLDIQTIPSNLPDEVISVDLSNNFMAPDQIFEICKYRLHVLSLAGNRISNLPDNQFENCSVIDTLDISNNDIDRLGQKSFYGLQSLRNLTGVEANYFENYVFTNLVSLRHLQITTHQISVPSNLFQGLQLHSLEFIIHGALELPAHIFDDVSSNLTSLLISSDSLEWLHPQQLENLRVLKSFALSCPSIRQISSKLLSNHDNLTSITLTGMRFIPRDFFSKLAHLEVLTLRDLEDIPSEVFEGLFSLQSLDVRRCTIPTIPQGWFYDLSGLETLVLKSNGVSYLKREDMRFMSYLKVLDISHNNLREIPDDVFRDVIDTVEDIDLSHNKMRAISAEHFKGAVKLEVLNLSHNQLRSIEDGSFRELPQLKELNLESNYIKLIQPDMLEASQLLDTLDVSTNSITNIPEELLQATKKLQILDFSENEVTYIGDSSVYPISTLTVLDMRYNPIECDCELYKLKLKLETSKTDLRGTCNNGVNVKYYVPQEQCIDINTTPAKAPSDVPTSAVTSTTGHNKSPTSSPVQNRPLASTPAMNNLDNTTLAHTSSGFTTPTHNELMTATSVQFTLLNSTLVNDKPMSSTPINNKSGISTPVNNESVTSTPVHNESVTSTPVQNEFMSPTQVFYKSETSTSVQTESEPSTPDYKYKLVTGEIYFQRTDDSNISNSTRKSEYKENGEFQEVEMKSVLISTTFQYGDKITAPQENVTHAHPNLEMEEIINYQPVTETSHKIAVGCIVGVSVLCILVVILILFKRRRGRQYDVSQADEEASMQQEFTPLKEVPSIQIQKVDAENNVNVEIYKP